MFALQTVIIVDGLLIFLISVNLCSVYSHLLDISSIITYSSLSRT